MRLIKIIITVILSQYIFGCVEKTTYSGKLIGNDDLDLNILNKNELINKFGQPSYIDNLSNKYFYFTEKKKEINFYNKKIEYSYLFVFEINDNDKIINSESINLLKDKNHKYRKIQTSNNIIRRGLLETIFGGIGTNPMPNSP
jgi:outer membrane protein assembly factor BamE (lipoprotein component of BamABCDE complex)